MIKITKLNDREMIVNCDLIESMEALPDTTITMTTGRKYIAKDTIEDILKNIIAFKQQTQIKIN